MTLPQALDAALQLQLAGRFTEAEAIYRQILSLLPEHPDALNRLGVLAHDTGRAAEAIDLLRRAIAAAPHFPDFHLNLGRVLLSHGRAGDAVDCLRSAVALAPDDATAHHALGVALDESGHSAAAVAPLRTATALTPGNADAWVHLSLALQHAAGDIDEAAAAAQKAIALDPKLPAAHMNLAAALLTRECFAESIVPLKRALELDPHRAPAHAALAGAMHMLGWLDEGVAGLKRALELDPTFASAASALLYTLHFRTAHSQREIFDQHVAWAGRFAPPPATHLAHTNDRSPDRPLRIGYLSPDFRSHSVTFFFEPLLDHHDRGAFETFCYHAWPKSDQATLRLRARATHWREVASLSDANLASLIREDRIDILVDLAGHTANNRLIALALRPAPVQVTYLGYPDTTGLSQINYRLTDAIADPPGPADALHTERLIRLPCAWCYRPPAGAPEVGPTPASTGDDGITFGCFNHLTKLSPESIAKFAGVLKATPRSRLLLKSRGLDQLDVQERLRGDFSRHGIAPGQIELLPTTPRHRDHLAAHRRIDLALDTFPYAGTTTTCEALWMGVPVVTLAGEAHVSRVGASLLSTVGMNDWIAGGPEQFIQIASSFAADLPRLIELRRSLRKRLTDSPLLDAASFARHVEAAFRRMWKTWTGSARWTGELFAPRACSTNEDRA